MLLISFPARPISKAAKIAIVICSAAFVFATASAILFARWLDRELSPADYRDTSVLAYEACQQFVERSLKVPGSATWPEDIARDSEPLGNGRFRVQSHVIAKNALGVPVRTAFVCTVRFENETWELESITSE